MEPAVLTAGAIAVLVPYVKKAAEEFAGEVGKSVFEKTKALWSWVKGKFTAPVEAEVVKRFEEDPERYRPFLEDLLVSRLEKSPELTSEFAHLIQEIKAAGPAVNIVINMNKAEEVLGLRLKQMTKGKVDVRLNIGEGKKITGAEIDQI
jgi:hypothetical protein